MSYIYIYIYVYVYIYIYIQILCMNDYVCIYVFLTHVCIMYLFIDSGGPSPGVQGLVVRILGGAQGTSALT